MDNGGFRWQPAVKVQTINGREVFNVNEYAWGGGGPRYSGIEISNDAYETLTLSGIATSKGRQYATPFLLNLPAGETSGTPSNLAGDYIAAIAIKSDIMGYQGAPTLNLAGILLNPEFLSTDPKGRADTVDNVYGYFYEPIALPSYHSNHYSFYGSSGRMKVANYEFDNEESLTGHDGDALRYNASTGRIALSAASYGSLKKTTATPLYFGPTDTLVTGMTSGVSLNTTLTDSTITVGVAGVYEITYTGTVSLDPTAGGTYLVTFSLYNNSTELGETLSEYEIVASASSNWFGNISGHTVMSLAESDVISLRYSGNTEVPSELRNVSLSVKKL